jgi:SAM-dependent methyltransferase
MTGHSADFWTTYQPGFRFSAAEPGTPEFFSEVERHRYELEPHIPEIVDFPRWASSRVLEVGCGVATDGLQFARAGADYTGLDSSDRGLELARARFELEGAAGDFVAGSAIDLPFDDESFDLVYSHGVIHHLHETRRAVAEIHRVLKPNGIALVMLYHRNSLNYYVNILLIRRLLALLLLLPGATRVLGAVTGEPEMIAGHRALLASHGLRYLRDRSLFLSNNTDGPGNPLSKVYSRDEARLLFEDFDAVQTSVRFLNLRVYPAGERLALTRVARTLEARLGWHLYVTARKGSRVSPA